MRSTYITETETTSSTELWPIVRSITKKHLSKISAISSKGIGVLVRHCNMRLFVIKYKPISAINIKVCMGVRLKWDCFPDMTDIFLLAGKVTDPTLFRDLDMQEMVKVAMQSQMRQDVVPYTLYMYLVPNKADVGTLGNPESTYAKGVRVSYKLLDLLSISAKHRCVKYTR